MRRRQRTHDSIGWGKEREPAGEEEEEEAGVGGAGGLEVGTDVGGLEAGTGGMDTEETECMVEVEVVEGVTARPPQGVRLA